MNTRQMNTRQMNTRPGQVNRHNPGRSGAAVTRSQQSVILQLIRRGERSERIAQIVDVPEPVVEDMLDRYVCREMGW